MPTELLCNRHASFDLLFLSGTWPPADLHLAKKTGILPAFCFGSVRGGVARPEE
jgi:hypothetical protein